jgi:hypothetical protein
MKKQEILLAREARFGGSQLIRVMKVKPADLVTGNGFISSRVV